MTKHCIECGEEYEASNNPSNKYKPNGYCPKHRKSQDKEYKLKHRPIVSPTNGF